MTARKKGNKWQADFLFRGERVRKAFSSQQTAERYERDAKDCEKKLALPLPDPVPYENGWTLKSFVDEFFDSIWSGVKRKDYAREQIDHVISLIGPEQPLGGISSTVILGMENKLRKAGRKESTINRKRSAISKVLQFASDYEYITKKPHAFSKETGGRERILEVEEEERLFNYMKHIGVLESYYLAMFLLYSGCRLGEALSLQWREVKPDFSYVTFLKSKTKTGKTRQVPLAVKAQEPLQWAFKNNLERPFRISEDTFRGHWNLARSHMGATDDPEFIPHMLRHTCCTRLVTGGVDLILAGKWLGHTNHATTLRYAHLVPNTLEKGLEVLNKYS